MSNVINQEIDQMGTGMTKIFKKNNKKIKLNFLQSGIKYNIIYI